MKPSKILLSVSAFMALTGSVFMLVGANPSLCGISGIWGAFYGIVAIIAMKINR